MTALATNSKPLENAALPRATVAAAPPPVFHAAAIPGVPELWQVTQGDPLVCVAIIDGPANLDHPCLRGANLGQTEIAASCQRSSAAAFDHGTQVASLIFGQPGSPVRGLAPRCRGLLIPIFSCDEASGQLQPAHARTLAQAIRQAAEAGADIINISGGQPRLDDGSEQELREAIESVADRALIVAAVGNEGGLWPHVPGVFPTVLAVGSMSAAGEPSAFSNFSPEYQNNGILAPGENWLTARGDGSLTTVSGTSFSTAALSGIAALLLSWQRSHRRPLSPVQLRQTLLETAVACELRPTSNCPRLLGGRLNLPAARTSLQRSESTLSISAIPQGTEPMNFPAPASSKFTAAAGYSGPSGPSGITAACTSAPASQPAAKPAGCGCGCGCSAAPLQIVFPVGTLNYDFPSVARELSIQQHMDTIKATGYKPHPRNKLDLLRHLLGFSEYQVEYFQGKVTDITNDLAVTGSPKSILVTLDKDVFDPADPTKDQFRRIELQGIRIKNDSDKEEALNGTKCIVRTTAHTPSLALPGNQFILDGYAFAVPASRDLKRAEFLFPRTCFSKNVVKHPARFYDARALIWLLVRDRAPLFAIAPDGPYAEDAYRELAMFLLHSAGLEELGLNVYYTNVNGVKGEVSPPWDPCFNAVDECHAFADPSCYANYQNRLAIPKKLRVEATDRVAIPGTLTGKTRLSIGQDQFLDTINPDMRGTSEWSFEGLVRMIKEVRDELKKQGETVPAEKELENLMRDLVARLTEEVRNSGRRVEERALNFAAVELIRSIILSAGKFLGETLHLDTVFPPQRSEVCQENSECFTVSVSFFNPDNVELANTVVSLTVDVSDVVPALLDEPRAYRRRA